MPDFPLPGDPWKWHFSSSGSAGAYVHNERGQSRNDGALGLHTTHFVFIRHAMCATGNVLL